MCSKPECAHVQVHRELRRHLKTSSTLGPLCCWLTDLPRQLSPPPGSHSPRKDPFLPIPPVRATRLARTSGCQATLAPLLLYSGSVCMCPPHPCLEPRDLWDKPHLGWTSLGKFLSLSSSFLVYKWKSQHPPPSEITMQRKQDRVC